MKTNNYWAERNRKTAQNLTNKSIAATDKQLVKYYSSCQNNIIRSMEILYSELKGEISAGKDITPADLYKLDRYWQLQSQLTEELTKLGNKQAKLFNKQFITQFQTIYNSLAIVGGEEFTKLDDKIAQQLINRIWCADGRSWSQRVWNNTTNLRDTLNQELVHCVVTGEKTSGLVKRLQNDFGVSYNQAATLTRTEMSHIENSAAIERYKDAGIEEFEILADDSCDCCSEHDGERFSIYDANPVPFHPNCRCCVVPVVKEV